MSKANPFANRPDSALTTSVRIPEQKTLSLPKIAEVELDQDYATTVQQLLGYITVLERNQQELMKMIETITTDLPAKLQQKVEKYLFHYQQNVIDKQITEVQTQAESLLEEGKDKISQVQIKPEDLEQRLKVVESVYNQEAMNQLFEDVAQIRQMLGQLYGKVPEKK
ncbi:hypothetical protein SS50377_25036 [Spironucleus salmonicida]|uniref:Uncharacterized protein n=1 Tax=Spironucleus salmonicida TaxID=348837 RepID=V6LQQ8_9EUKA|nr:hypothetical protein SS50377_25036 [Spironucleus salmonicida]|eukprot:EST43089.1 Hypothetical protein SS50377_17246 [Spironucleus salmonicida]